MNLNNKRLESFHKKGNIGQRRAIKMHPAQEDEDKITITSGAVYGKTQHEDKCPE